MSEVRHQHGFGASCQRMAARAARRLLRLELSRMVCLEIDRLPATIGADPKFIFRFLTADEIARLAAEPSYELAPEFVARAGSSSDLCFAALDHDQTVAHYGWYATGSIDGEHHMGVPMLLADDVAYMYNAFTHPAFRGRRLHGTAMALAARELAAHGISRIVSTIGATNFASLRSFYRLGFVDIGPLWTMGSGGLRWSLKPKIPESLGVRFGGKAVAQTC